MVGNRADAEISLEVAQGRDGSFSTKLAGPCHVCYFPDSDHTADITGGRFALILEVTRTKTSSGLGMVSA